MRDAILLQQGLENHVNRVLYSVLGSIRVDGHNLECELADLDVDHEDEVSLQRAIARGVALGLMEYAEGKDPMASAPVLHSSTPRALLEGWR